MAERIPFHSKLQQSLRETQCYDELITLAAKHGLALRGSDAESGIETEARPDGRVELTLRFPIDDNSNPKDGRIYLRDSFVFDAKKRALLEHRRGLEPIFNRKLSPLWKQRWLALSKFSDEATHGIDPRLKSFADQLLASRPVPLSPDARRKMRNHQAFLKDAVGSLLLGDSNWQVQIREPAHGFWASPRQWNLALPAMRVDALLQPKIWLQLQFETDPNSGKLIKASRHWRLHPGLSAAEKKNWKALVTELNQSPDLPLPRYQLFWEFAERELAQSAAQPIREPVAQMTVPKAWKELARTRAKQRDQQQIDLKADLARIEKSPNALENWLGQAAKQLLNPVPVAVLGAASLVGGISRAWVTRTVSGWFGKAAAPAIGLVAEASAVTVLNRAVQSPDIGSSIPRVAPLKELLGNMLLLGGIRAPVSGISALTAGRVEGSKLIRMLPGAGGVAGAVLSQAIGRRLGLVPGGAKSWREEIFEGGTTWAHAMVGWNLANRLTKHRLPNLLKQLEAVQAGRKSSLPAAGPAAQPISQSLFHQVPLPPPLAKNGSPIPDLILQPIQTAGPKFAGVHLLDHVELALDPYIFQRESSSVLVRKNLTGGYQLRDNRILQNPNKMSGDEARLIDFAEQMPLSLDGKLVPWGHWTPLQSGQTLSYLARGFHLQIPSQDPLLRTWYQLDESAQRKALLGLSFLKDRFESKASGIPNMLAERFSKVWRGEDTLFNLPSGPLQEIIGKAMGKRLEQWKREGFDPSIVELDQSPGYESLGLEAEFQRTVAAKRLDGAISQVKTWRDLQQVLRSCGIHRIAGVEVGDLVKNIERLEAKQVSAPESFPHRFPHAFGIRQKVRDLSEQFMFRKFYQQPIQETVRWIRENDFATRVLELIRVRWDMIQRFRDRLGADQEKVLESIEQVLDRDKPIEWLSHLTGVRETVLEYQKKVVTLAMVYFADQLKDGLNHYSGEAVRNRDFQTVYRYANHLLNAKAGRPVRGMPTAKETAELVATVNKHFKSNLRSYPEAQFLLRKHLDQASLEAFKMLEQASPREKIGILDAYFGDFRRRDLPAKTAFQVAVLMGMAGMYREVGVTYQIRQNSLEPTLSLGDLSFVMSQDVRDFFLMHSHPEQYLNSDGEIMGGELVSKSGAEPVTFAVTLNRGMNRSQLADSDNQNVLFSQQDVRLFVKSANSYWLMGYPKQFGDTPLYESAERVFKNFVFHPYGASEIRISLNAKGDPENVLIRYTLRDGFYGKGENYLRQLGRLLSLNHELGVPISSERVDNESFVKALPFSVKTFF